jgi:hypothetical protein
MTGSELRDLLIRDIIRSHGGGTARWRKVIGAVKVYARDTHAHCNWDLRPAGTAHEVAVVERAADGLRARHPFVDAD